VASCSESAAAAAAAKETGEEALQEAAAGHSGSVSQPSSKQQSVDLLFQRHKEKVARHEDAEKATSVSVAADVQERGQQASSILKAAKLSCYERNEVSHMHASVIQGYVHSRENSGASESAHKEETYEAHLQPLDPEEAVIVVRISLSAGVSVEVVVSVVSQSAAVSQLSALQSAASQSSAAKAAALSLCCCRIAAAADAARCPARGDRQQK
jgi:hypothetical protein